MFIPVIKAETHRRNLLRKFKASNMDRAVKIAVAKKLLKHLMLILIPNFTNNLSEDQLYMRAKFNDIIKLFFLSALRSNPSVNASKIKNLNNVIKETYGYQINW